MNAYYEEWAPKDKKWGDFILCQQRKAVKDKISAPNCPKSEMTGRPGNGYADYQSGRIYIPTDYMDTNVITPALAALRKQ